MLSYIRVGFVFCLLALAAVACGSSKGSSAAATATVAVATSPSASLAPSPTTPTTAPSTSGRGPDVPPGGAPGGPGGGGNRVSGVVQGVAAGTVTLADGTSFSLAPTPRITRMQNGGAGDLKVGQLVAVTAKRQSDNSLLASIVMVFPASSSIPTSQFSLPEGNLMTNATIDSVTGKSFTVTFTGGGAKVNLDTGAQVILTTDATAADIKAGQTISASVNNGVAQSVTIQ